MSLGRARAMSQLAGEADLLSPGKQGSPQPVGSAIARSVNGKRASWGVNGSGERRAHPPKAGHLEGTLAIPATFWHATPLVPRLVQLVPPPDGCLRLSRHSRQAP